MFSITINGGWCRVRPLRGRPPLWGLLGVAILFLNESRDAAGESSLDNAISLLQNSACHTVQLVQLRVKEPLLLLLFFSCVTRSGLHSFVPLTVPSFNSFLFLSQLQFLRVFSRFDFPTCWLCPHHNTPQHTTTHTTTTPHHTTPHYTTLHHTTLHHTTLHHTALHHTPHHTTTHHNTPQHTPPQHHTTPHHTTLHHTTLHHTAPHCTTPHYTTHHTTLHHTAHHTPHHTIQHTTPHHTTPPHSTTPPHHHTKPAARVV